MTFVKGEKRMYSVSQVIEQLLLTNTKNKDSSDSETICECSVGSLNFNSVTDLKYEPQKGCSKNIICFFVATEKHKARISTKHFLRHKDYNTKREKAKFLKVSSRDKSVSNDNKTGQKTLLDYLK